MAATGKRDAPPRSSRRSTRADSVDGADADRPKPTPTGDLCLTLLLALICVGSIAFMSFVVSLAEFRPTIVPRASAIVELINNTTQVDDVATVACALPNHPLPPLSTFRARSHAGRRTAMRARGKRAPDLPAVGARGKRAREARHARTAARPSTTSPHGATDALATRWPFPDLRPGPSGAACARARSSEINAPTELKMKLLAIYLANGIELGSRLPVYARRARRISAVRGALHPPQRLAGRPCCRQLARTHARTPPAPPAACHSPPATRHLSAALSPGHLGPIPFPALCFPAQLWRRAPLFRPRRQPHVTND